jgi:hypothetical protein
MRQKPLHLWMLGLLLLEGPNQKALQYESGVWGIRPSWFPQAWESRLSIIIGGVPSHGIVIYKNSWIVQRELDYVLNSLRLFSSKPRIGVPYFSQPGFNLTF